MSRNVLILLWRTAELLAVYCGEGQVRLAGRVPCLGRDARSAVEELLGAVRTSGVSIPADVRLLLGYALFRSWQLPLRSRRKALQSLELLMDGEFPFENEALEHRTVFCGRQSGGLRALSVSVLRESFEQRLSALRELGIEPSFVTAEPLPELMTLPAELRRSTVLFVTLKGDHGYAVVMDHGRPRNIVRFSAGKGTENLASSLKFVLHGQDVQKLAVHGEGRRSAEELGKALNLPLVSAGLDVFDAGVQEPEGWRESAEAVLRMPMPGTLAWIRRSFDIPLFQNRAARTEFSACSRAVLAVACGVLLVAAAWMSSVWAEDMAFRKAADRYEAEARSAALKAVPQLRRQMTLGQLESALRGRLEERAGAQTQEGGWIMPFLQAVHGSVPQSSHIQLDSLRTDSSRQGAFTAALSGTVGEYQDVNAFRDALAAKPGVREVRVVQAVSRSTGQDRTGGGTSLPISFELQILLEGQGR